MGLQVAYNYISNLFKLIDTNYRQQKTNTYISYYPVPLKPLKCMSRNISHEKITLDSCKSSLIIVARNYLCIAMY